MAIRAKYRISNVDAQRNGAFTLPDADTDTETDKIAHKPMEFCVCVCL